MNLGASEIIVIVLIVVILFGIGWAYNKRNKTGGGGAPSNDKTPKS